MQIQFAGRQDVYERLTRLAYECAEEQRSIADFEQGRHVGLGEAQADLAAQDDEFMLAMQDPPAIIINPPGPTSMLKIFQDLQQKLGSERTTEALGRFWALLQMSAAAYHDRGQSNPGTQRVNTLVDHLFEELGIPNPSARNAKS
ncbi:MAG TPA: hypothetical protein V6C52_05045 [Coleofasciculaceae cyanobacterium]